MTDGVVAKAALALVLVVGCGGEESRWRTVEVDAARGASIAHARGIGENLWAVGDRGQGVVLFLDGVEWSDLAAGAGLPPLISVLPLSVDDVWVGGNGAPGTENLWHWDGTGWRSVDAELTGGAPLAAVQTIWGTADDLWISAELSIPSPTEAVFRRRARGWTEVTGVTDLLAQFNEDSAQDWSAGSGCRLAGDDVWFQIYIFPDIVTLSKLVHWDGSTWSLASSPGDPGRIGCFRGQLWTWGVTGTVADGDETSVPVLHRLDEGNWIPLATPLGHRERQGYPGFWAADDEVWLVGGERGGDSTEVRVYHHDASGWAEEAEPLGLSVAGATALQTVWQTSSGQVWALGASGLVLSRGRDR